MGGEPFVADRALLDRCGQPVVRPPRRAAPGAETCAGSSRSWAGVRRFQPLFAHRALRSCLGAQQDTAMAQAVVMNGAVCPVEEAKVSLFDRGFLYGDSVYEVLRTYGGVPFELGLHLDRLEASGERIGLSLPASKAVLAEESRRAHRASQNDESYLRIVVTRGIGSFGLDPGLAEDPLRVVLALPVKPPPEALYVEGASVEVVGVRRNLPEAVDPRAKTGNYLNSVLALREARARGAHEAIMLDASGQVTEGASSNVFVVMDGLLLTPPVRVGILEGITRRSVLEVCRRSGRRVLELPIGPEVLTAADEVFITSSIREILPVVRVNGEVVGDGRPGPVVQELREGFAAFVKERCALGA